MIRANFVVSSFCVVLFLTVASDAYQNKYCGLPCIFPNKVVPHTVCQRAEQNCGPDPRCGPDFHVVPLTDDDRQYILDIHNYLRNKIALGGEPGQPPAANMKTMSYNRELEYITQCWVNTCKGKTLQHDVCRRTTEYEYVGQNLGITGSTSISKLDLVKAIKQLILVWYNEVKNFDSRWIEETKLSNAFVGHYTQLAWADSSEVGCAASYYTSYRGSTKWHHLLFGCNYGPAGNVLGLPLYKIGKPCSKCQGGKQNVKYKGLCGNSKPVNTSRNFYGLFS